MKEQTIREYAKISNIPIKSVMEVFDCKGLSCKPDDILTKELRQKLTKYFTPEVIKTVRNQIFEEREAKAKEKENKAKEREAKAEDRAKEREAKLIIKARKIWGQAVIPGLKTVGEIIDICIDLLPINKITSLRENINNLDFSVYLCTSFIQYCENNKFNVLVNDNIIYCDIYSLYSSYATQKFSEYLDSFGEYYDFKGYLSMDSSDFAKTIARLRQNKEYSEGLCFSMLILIKAGLLQENNMHLQGSAKKTRLNYRVLQSIGELILDMGGIESALKLYSIDKGIFHKSKCLSKLIDESLKQSNIEQSQRLLDDLFYNEPYHPSIPIIKAEIKRLERMNQLKYSFSMDFEKLNELSGMEFENLMLDKFNALGLKAKSTPKTGDYGADLIVETSDGTVIIIQCKRFKSKVNLKAVQEVIGAIGHYAGDIGIVITNSLFLNSAIKLAESHDIELWDGDKLLSFLTGDLSFSNAFKVN